MFHWVHPLMNNHGNSIMRLKSISGIDEYLDMSMCIFNRSGPLATTIDIERFYDCITGEFDYDDLPQGDCSLLDSVLMLRITQNISSDGISEFTVPGRWSWTQFLGLNFGNPAPDENMIHLPPSHMTETEFLDCSIQISGEQLQEMDHIHMSGQIVHASMFSPLEQHDMAYENAAIKAEKLTHEIWLTDSNRDIEGDFVNTPKQERVIP